MSDVELPAANRAGHVETHGADYVPEAERRGTARSLFTVWAGSNVAYLYFVLGGLLTLIGLNLWQAVGVVLAANLLWVGVGYLATSGPAAGSPSEVVSRAFFGVNGNRVVMLINGWMVGVLYEAINLAVGALAGVALVQQFAPEAPPAAQAVVIVGLAVVTFTISVYGHATIVKLSPWFTWVLLAALVILAVLVVGSADLSYQPAGGSLSGPPLWAAVATGFAIIAAAPLSWPVGADYSRYLPSTTSSRSVLLWTALGGFVPATGIALLGVVAGTVVDMSSPVEAMSTIVPGWFYPVFLLVIVVGSISNNALTAYSTGLALLSVGVRWRRSRTILFDAAIAIGVTLYAVFVSDFLGTLSALLELSIVVLAPMMAIYALDIYLRRNRYDGPALQDLSSSSRFWFRGGFNVGGFVGLLIAAAVSLLFVSTTLFVGPLAAVMGGASVSIPIGASLGAGIYLLLEGRRVRQEVTTGSGRAGSLSSSATPVAVDGRRP